MFRLRYLLPLVLVISLLAVPASSSANAPSATASTQPVVATGV